MKHLKLFVLFNWLLLSLTCSFGQQVKYQLDFSPIKLSMMNGLVTSQNVQYDIRWKKHGLSLFFDAIPITHFDHRKTSSEFPKLTPRFIFSQLNYQFQIFNQQSRFKKQQLLVDIGYLYAQYGVFKKYSNDYFIEDSINNGFRKILGSRKHSLKIGGTMEFKKYHKSDSNKLKMEQEISINILIGLTSSFTRINDYTTYQEKTTTTSQYPMTRIGSLVRYQFTYYLAKRFGIYCRITATYLPHLNYSPNTKYYIPRGGELENNFILSNEIGIRWKIN